MRRACLIAALASIFTLGPAASAFADVTAFLGISPTPARHPGRGFALGINLLVVGFEFEYAGMSDNEIEGVPSLRTGMINGLIQTPTSGAQFYLTAGGGFYRERLLDQSTTSFGTNIGGGIKFSLVGPIRLRLDYRVFNLRGSPLYNNPQRFYAGLNIAF